MACLASRSDLFFSFPFPRGNLINYEFRTHLRFLYSKNHPLSTLVKRMFRKNGFAKRKNESATTAIQEYFLFAWLYYSAKFYFVNRLLKKILGFCRINFEKVKKIAQ